MEEVHPKQQSETRIYMSRTILVGALVFSIVLGWLAYRSFVRVSDANSGPVVVQVVIMLVCFVVGIKSLHLLFFRKLLLVLTSEGLYSKKLGKILWRDVDKVIAEPRWVIGPTFAVKSYAFYIQLKTGEKLLLNTALYPVSSIELVRLMAQYLYY